MAGVREVDMLPALRDELVRYKATSGTGSNSLVFAPSTGTARDKDNARETFSR